MPITKVEPKKAVVFPAQISVLDQILPGGMLVPKREPEYSHDAKYVNPECTLVVTFHYDSDGRGGFVDFRDKKTGMSAFFEANEPHPKYVALRLVSFTLQQMVVQSTMVGMHDPSTVSVVVPRDEEGIKAVGKWLQEHPGEIPRFYNETLPKLTRSLREAYLEVFKSVLEKAEKG